MCIMLINASSHIQVPEGQTSISVTHAGKTGQLRLYRIISINKRCWGEYNLVHVAILSGIYCTDLRFRPQIPESDELVSSNRHGTGAIWSHLDRINASFMAFKVCYISSSFTIPDLYILVVYFMLIHDYLLKPPDNRTKSSLGLKQTVLTIA